jgi:MFS family permease
VVSAYTVAFAALILSAGAMGDRIGAKRVFIAGFLLFTLASGVCGLAPSLGVLIAARAVQGIGAAMLVPCSLTLLNHSYTERRERERAVGLWAAGASVALSAGPLVGGVLTSALSWRAIFFINAPLGVLGIWLTARFADETSRSAGRGIDLPGQLAAVVVLLALTGAMIEGGVKGFSSGPVLADFALALTAAASFVAREARGAKPMLPVEPFRSRTFSAATRRDCSSTSPSTPDLRAQPVLSAHPASLAARHRPVLRADDWRWQATCWPGAWPERSGRAARSCSEACRSPSAQPGCSASRARARIHRFSDSSSSSASASV